MWKTTRAAYTTLAAATAPLITLRQTLPVSPPHWKEVGSGWGWQHRNPAIILGEKQAVQHEQS